VETGEGAQRRVGRSFAGDHALVEAAAPQRANRTRTLIRAAELNAWSS